MVFRNLLIINLTGLFHYSYKCINHNIISKKTMTDFHFVIIGTVKGESKEVALEILKTIMNKNEEIKDISELNIFGKTL